MCTMMLQAGTVLHCI